MLVLMLAFTAAVIPDSRLAMSTAADKFPVTLSIQRNDETINLLTFQDTLLAAIDEAGIAIGEHDLLSLPEDTVLDPGLHYDVTIRSLSQVNLTWSGYSVDTAGVFGSMEDLMSRSGFGRLDRLGLQGEDAPVDMFHDDGTYFLNYVDIKKQIVHQYEDIPYSSVTIDDPTIYAGTTRVGTNGQTGTRELIYEETYEDGIFVSSVQIGSKVVKEPVQEVIHRGTRPKLTYAPINYRTLTSTVKNSFNKIRDFLNPQGGNRSYQSFADNNNGTITVDGRTFSYTAMKKRTITMYDGLDYCMQLGCHTPAINHNTFSGLPAQRGLVATFGIRVSGRFTGSILPMGTILFVEGYGLGVVADIHGMRNNPDLIDVCFDPGEIRSGVATIGKVTRRVYILDIP